MQLQEINFDGQPPVDSYGPGFFRINGEITQGHLLLTRDGAAPWGGFEDLAPLIAAKGDYDVIFIGTGAEIRPLPKDMREKLEEEAVPVEVMGTPSACRTYNILLSEERRVALAALIV